MMDSVLFGQIITAVFAAITAISVAVFGLKNTRTQSNASKESTAINAAATSSAAKTQLEIINIQELWAYAKNLESRYDARVMKLEEAVVFSNSQNDNLIIENAKLNAQVTLLTVQTSQQTVQIAQLETQQRTQVSEHTAQNKALTEERDSLRRELEEARRRIGELERKVRLLQNPGLNMQTEGT